MSKIKRLFWKVFHCVWFWVLPRKTCHAVKSGRFDDPLVWEDGKVPRRWDSVDLGYYSITTNNDIYVGTVEAWFKKNDNHVGLYAKGCNVICKGTVKNSQ
jgi:hypothetical protein